MAHPRPWKSSRRARSCAVGMRISEQLTELVAQDSVVLFIEKIYKAIADLVRLEQARVILIKRKLQGKKR